jgi:indole-3-acetate monooxygenase
MITTVTLSRSPDMKTQSIQAQDFGMSNSNDDLPRKLLDLAPKIAARASEIEAAREMPVDLIAKLRSLGVFRTLVPRSHGGLELPLPEGLEVIRTLSRIDGSVGWSAMILGLGGASLAQLPRETYERVYHDSGDPVLASSFKPDGKAEAREGGWIVNGRWSFLSGCQHADWIAGACVMMDAGRPLPGRLGEAGPPLVRAVLMPASVWHIENDWDAPGLKGTGSHHASLRDVFVPAANCFDVLGPSCVPGPLYGALLHIIPLLNTAVIIGIVESAVADIVDLAGSGRQQLMAPAPMKDSEWFQGRLGRLTASLRAAQAYFEAQVANHWRHALAGSLSDVLRFEGLQTAVWVAATSVAIADECFALAGSHVLSADSALARRQRDLHVARQHIWGQERHYPEIGRVVLRNKS